ncbi:hypothetical protein ACFSKL_15035 [Belliella marina]|uniref:Uncharacterized protein n=1 Tax=Belliella marina TaxID=1644146 RepID=A0ABW4VR95_9BACT
MSIPDLKISKNIQTQDDLDFDFLRKKGIEYIEQLGGKLWTDFNTHDPGITTLELLCYAITDLGLRINMPIQDLLNPDESSKQFFEAHEIMPNRALTTLDYRKLFIDIDPLKINNCFLKPFSQKLFINCRDAKVSLLQKSFEAVPKELLKEANIRGLYTLWVDFSEDVPNTKSLETELWKTYHSNRNLCEDLVEIKAVGKQEIKVCADIELSPQADENLVNAQILLAIDQYFSPKVKIHSLGAMLEKGFSTDEIFEGPLLKHGFIVDEELRKNQLRSEVRLSDLMNLILKIDGVLLIHDMSISFCNGNAKEADDLWNLCIKEGHKPILCKGKSVFSFRKENLPINMDQNAIQSYRKILMEDQVKNLDKISKDLRLGYPAGKKVNIGNYHSITNNFPENYGVGIHGLSDNETPARHAQAKQLKAYLLFFDQILATYFKHLVNVKEQLSISNDFSNSYFIQAVTDIKGIHELVEDYDSFDWQELVSKFDDQNLRNSKIKDHLIARFSENFGNYAFLMKSIYGKASEEIVHNNKRSFLGNYDLMSSTRATAFNYYKQSIGNIWNCTNVSGLENRIAGLLGIKLSDSKAYKRETISEKFVELYKVNDDQYRWRIRDASNQIILTATENYDTYHAAEKEMYQSIYKIINSNRQEIKLIKNPNIKRKTVNVIEIVKSDSGKFSFNIINPNIKPFSNPKRIIARQFKYYDTIGEVRDAVLDSIEFFIEEFCDEGIHLLEHILMLPHGQEQKDESYYLPICADDCGQGCNADPYTFRISIVLPGYTQRFSDINFRNFAEDLIRKEIPAHILAKICWVGHRKNTVKKKDNDLLQFEEKLRNFLIDKAAGKQDSIPELINAIQNLNNIYPKGQLHDCDTQDVNGKIILGRTNI